MTIKKEVAIDPTEPTLVLDPPAPDPINPPTGWVYALNTIDEPDVMKIGQTWHESVEDRLKAINANIMDAHEKYKCVAKFRTFNVVRVEFWICERLRDSAKWWRDDLYVLDVKSIHKLFTYYHDDLKELAERPPTRMAMLPGFYGYVKYGGEWDAFIPHDLRDELTPANPAPVIARLQAEETQLKQVRQQLRTKKRVAALISRAGV